MYVCMYVCMYRLLKGVNLATTARRAGGLGRRRGNTQGEDLEVLGVGAAEQQAHHLELVLARGRARRDA